MTAYGVSIRRYWSCIGNAGVKVPMTRRPRLQHPQTRGIQSNSSIFKASEEVREAIEAKRPVVALESTIYTHGLPKVDAIRLSARLEDIVRQEGGVPATIGVLDGIARVGLAEAEIAQLVEKPGPRKISRRDFGLALKNRSVHGGTTIAGTMILAHLAGIKVFATGGLGGVHRGGQESLDISADLTELGRTPVTVICSGCKGFLDIGRTLEYLETQGVGVATFADGRTGPIDFPAFWSRDSGFLSPAVLMDEQEAAKVIYAQTHLPIYSGLLFANPVPQDSSISRSELDDIIRQAIEAANKAGATGSSNTPFILSAIKDLSGGRSVRANEALVEANVRRGAKVAVELSKLEREARDVTASKPSGKSSLPRNHVKSDADGTIYASDSINVLVAGSVAMDTACTYKPSSTALHRGDQQPVPHTSNPATITQTLGGVGANLARAAQLAGAKARLCTVVGDDLAGNIARESLAAASIDCKGVSQHLPPTLSQVVQRWRTRLTLSEIHTAPSSTTVKTSQYVAVNDAHCQLAVGMADMAIIEHPHGRFEDLWMPHIQSLSKGSVTPWLIVDANWNTEILHQFLNAAREAQIATAFEPVSVAKSSRLFESPNLLPGQLPRVCDLASPNELELIAMHDAARSTGATDRADWWQTIDALGIPGSGARAELVAATNQALVNEGVPQRSIQMLPFVPNMVTKLGPRGVLLTRILPENDVNLDERHWPYVISRSKTGANRVGGLYVRLFPPDEVLAEEDIVSVNGAGDTFLGTLVARLVGAGDARLEHAIDFAQRASLQTLKSNQSVSPAIAAH